MGAWIEWKTVKTMKFPTIFVVWENEENGEQNGMSIQYKLKHHDLRSDMLIK
jgi:hypothetical protein